MTATTATNTPAGKKTVLQAVTLWYYEFCQSNLGVLDREWSLSKSELEQAQAVRLQQLGTSIKAGDDFGGNYGDVGPICSTVVELTPQGLLGFACNYAVDPNCG